MGVAVSRRTELHPVEKKSSWKEQFQKINESLGLDGKFVPPILHENHTISYVKHLIQDGKLPNSILETLEKAGITETLPQDLPELNRFFSDNDGTFEKQVG